MSTVMTNETGPGLPATLPATLEPDRSLLKYYMLTALMFGPAMLFAAVPLYFRYRTLRYQVDDEGITMRWGILFRREISLTYARIQDIQLTSNVVERWLGLARIKLQTASGSATAEMTIEGTRDVEGMRDFLYSRMRGARDGVPAGRAGPDGSAARPVGSRAGRASAAQHAVAAANVDAADVAELTAALDAVAAELRALHDRLDGAGLRTGPGAGGLDA